MVSFFFIKIGIHPVMYAVYFAPFLGAGSWIYLFGTTNMASGEAAWAGAGIAIADLILGAILLSLIGQPKVRTIDPIPSRSEDPEKKESEEPPTSVPSKTHRGARTIAPIPIRRK